MVYTGIYVGKVVQVDPNKVGYYRILVASVHGNLHSSQYNLLEWVNYTSSTLNIGDRVMVMFENGDKYRPVCLKLFS